MLVKMNGEIIQQAITESLEFESQIEAAIEIQCDVRTLRRAIKGKSVLLSTATRICKVLKLDPKELIITGLDQETPLLKTSEHNAAEFSPEIVKKAYLAAEQAISGTLKSNSSYNYNSYSTVLVGLLARYIVEGAPKGAPPALHLMDDISRRAKSLIRTALSDEKFLDMFESD